MTDLDAELEPIAYGFDGPFFDNTPPLGVLPQNAAQVAAIHRAAPRRRVQHTPSDGQRALRWAAPTPSRSCAGSKPPLIPTTARIRGKFSPIPTGLTPFGSRVERLHEMLFGLNRPAAVANAKLGIVWLRVLSSLPWIDSAFIGKDAKVAPTFLNGTELATRISTTFVHTALDSRIAQVLTWYVAPHAAVFAMLIAAADVAIGISFALGIFVRLGGTVAILRALVNIAVAGGAGADTIGYNGMLIIAAGICVATAAGRTFGIDGRLIDRFPRSAALRLIG